MRIKLTQGKYATVDEWNYEWLNQHKWYFHPKGYAVRHPGSRGKQCHIMMHRVILEKKIERELRLGEETDHINGDRLDNREENLRVASHSENAHNRGLQRNNTSGYKGVFWRKLEEKWQAQIESGGRKIHLGYFRTRKAAANAYAVASMKYHGEFGRT